MDDHILSIESLSVSRIEKIMSLADEIVEQDKWVSYLHGTALVNLFLEPSTRTRIGFDLGMKKMGGDVINLVGREATSMVKDESIKDTLAAISQFADVITIRTASRFINSDVDNCDCSVINAGDGDGEHPTQALGDLFTIRATFPKLENLNVLVMGDCKNARAIHSFVAICLKFGMKVCSFSPSDIELPFHYRTTKEKDETLSNKVNMIEDKQLDEALALADVIYCVRFQEERVKEKTTYINAPHIGFKTTKDNYAQRCGFKEDMLSKIGRNAIIMHPFPRGEEMPKKVDKTKHAAYFEQMRNGLYVKMAALRSVCDG